MCGLYGFLIYGNTKINRSKLTKSLSVEAAIRGADATGAAYNNNGHLKIYKKPQSAYDMKFILPEVSAVIGHTRHTTHGSAKNNFNNHPFIGRTDGGKFALAHNGVLMNDRALRLEFSLPETKIDTDSYIAVQLIEMCKKLDFENLKFMAEHISGSYSFSVLDDKDNIYLVKGDSPLCILHFPKCKIYVYASTPEILWKGIVDTSLFDDLKKQQYVEISIKDGDIIKLCSDGTVERNKFAYRECFDMYCDWRYYRKEHDPFMIEWNYSQSNDGDCCQTYIEDLKSVASSLGYSSDDVDELLNEGFMPEEIEEYLYYI